MVHFDDDAEGRMSGDNLDAVGGEFDPAAALAREFRRLQRKLQLELRVAAPAHVTKYDDATQRAVVALGFLPTERIEGVEVPTAPIPLFDVPVMLLGGSMGHVTVPIVPGDTGLVIFTDRCLDQWKLKGTPIEPGNPRTHDAADAVFIHGLRHNANGVKPTTDPSATVVEGPLVKLGKNAVQPAVRGADLLETLQTAITAAIAASVPNDGGTAALGALSTALGVEWPSTVSTKVQVE
jgi:hypothetical protein